MQYKTAKKLSLVEAAYIAGIIDGEGTITLTRRNAWRPRHIALTVSNCEYELLNYLLKTIRVGKITTKRTEKRHHAPSFTYQIYNRQALSVISDTVPYLRTYKKQRAQLVLKNYLKLTPRNGKYSPMLWRRRERFVKQFMSTIPQHKKTH